METHDPLALTDNGPIDDRHALLPFVACQCEEKQQVVRIACLNAHLKNFNTHTQRLLKTPRYIPMVHKNIHKSDSSTVDEHLEKYLMDLFKSYPFTTFTYANIKALQKLDTLFQTHSSTHAKFKVVYERFYCNGGEGNSLKDFIEAASYYE